ncbi:protein of unknown function [Xenorhabdus nematophila AN6/1]|nr:protein of unknown function [Xenorhabdus nematophila AN6/1]
MSRGAVFENNPTMCQIIDREWSKIYVFYLWRKIGVDYQSNYITSVFYKNTFFSSK